MKILRAAIKVVALLVVLSAIAQAAVDDGYVPAQGDLDKENIPAPLFMAIAYGIMWSGFVVFVLVLYRRMKLLSHRLRAAEERVRKLESLPPTGSI